MKLEVPGGENSWARLCDTCHSVPCTVYCRADSAYLCTSCDAKIHAANQVASRHERVFVCQACERAPAAFLCKADAASLCASCDADVHSANPLASRHQRVPIMPVGSGCLYGGFMGPSEVSETIDEEGDHEEEAASWLLLNNPAGAGKNIYKQNRNGVLSGEEASADEYLNLFEYYSGTENQFSEQYSQHHQEFNASDNYGSDSVVPVVQSGEGNDQKYQNFLFGMELETKPASNYGTSIAHNVPVSTQDATIVPESPKSNPSLSNPSPPKDTIDLFSGPPIQMPTQLSPLDREARVTRYREKKKTRKFEKTIRYASRKAYAETRPRIKGRFAKRSNVEAEVDEMFPNSLLAESGYGIVPSF